MKFYRKYFDEEKAEKITEKEARDRLRPDCTDYEWQQLKAAMEEAKGKALFGTAGAIYWVEDDEK